MSIKRKKLIVTLALITPCVFLFVSCGGRKPNPVHVYQFGDDFLTCEQIRVEQASINAEVSRLEPKVDKRLKNTALGAAGILTYGIAWYWMDFSKAEKIEIEAFRNRYSLLENLAAKKGCPAAPWEPAVRKEVSPEKIEERLQQIDELFKKGVISDTEHARLRQMLLEELRSFPTESTNNEIQNSENSQK